MNDIGRNDPCPCGSGQKYKKCCLGNVAPATFTPAPSSAQVEIALMQQADLALQAGDLQTALALVSQLEAMPAKKPALRALIYNNIGSVLHKAGDPPAAIAYFEKALAHDAKFALAYFNRGMSYFALGAAQEMMADFARATTLDPGNAVMWQKLSIIYNHRHEFEKTIEVLERALRLQPDYEDAWVSLAEAKYRLGDFAGARALFAELSERYPQNATIQFERTHLFSQIPASQAIIDQERAHFLAGIERLTQQGFALAVPERQVLNFPFYQAYHARDNTQMMRAMAAFFLKAAPSLNYTAPHCQRPRARKQKIRIGFMSAFFSNSLLNRFYGAILRELSRDPDFEVLIFSGVAQRNASAQGIMEIAHKYIVLPSSLADARAVIAREEVDILVYLEIGMSAPSYFLAFARLAPVQCVMSGHPVTTGIPNMDYYLSGRPIEPPNAQEHYTETLELLDHVLAVVSHSPVPAAQKTRAELGLPGEEARIYTCPVMLFKLHPDMDAVFAAILARDSKAEIVLFDSEYKTLWRKHLEARFDATIPPELRTRIRFLPFAKGDDFIHMVRAADAVLDIFHFAFGTTAYLMFNAEVPFVTLPGEFMRGRCGDGMYRQMGVTDLIAESQEHFIELAIKLASDKTFYRAMQQKIREGNPRLFDDMSVPPAYAAKLKELYNRT